MGFSTALATDLEKVCDLYRAATEQMDAQGINQWDERYPTREILTDDIARGEMELLHMGGAIAAAFTLNSRCDGEYAQGQWRFPTSHFCVIHRLCVHPAFQGQGVAGRIVDYIELSMLLRGYESIRLDAFSQNPSALRLYESHGYRKAGEVTFRKGLFYFYEKNLVTAEPPADGQTPEDFSQDITAILSHRWDNGADFFATPDKRLIKGSPFSTLEASCLLAELGLDPADPVLSGTAALIWSVFRSDGRFQLAPKSAIYPCHTAHAAKTLCYLGYAEDARLDQTFLHLLETQYRDGGWRCNKFSFGRGPETEFSNPGPTLTALDAFRFTKYLNSDPRLDRAVEFLLGHWQSRAPLGPCHYGIGTLFQQVTFPFLSYNLFYYVYVLSFYPAARADSRFLDALSVLQSKTANGKILVERPHAKLATLHICQKGKPSELATLRYREILKNLEE
ncbi:MAG: GNAT family N-acetyltransferase [Eubacteriales bacterium]|nr:GNAT family N-acetyltransferase [Eubacteriales bacterium]